MQLMHHIVPEGPNYRLRAVKDGLRVERLDYGSPLFHEEHMKFPHVPQRFLLTKVVVKEDLHFASARSCWKQNS